MAKGQIDHNEQFFLLPQLFQKAAAELTDVVFMLQRVKSVFGVLVNGNQRLPEASRSCPDCSKVQDLQL